MTLNQSDDTNYSKEYIGFDRGKLECETMFTQADLLIQEKQIQEAVELLLKILQCNPQFGKAHNHLGWIYEVDYKDYTCAEKFYKDAMKYAPEYAASYTHYARLLSQCGRFDELKEHLDMTLNIPNVSKELIYSEYAIMYEMQEDPKAAMNYYVKAAMVTFDKTKLQFYKEAIDRCKIKIELKDLSGGTIK